MNSKTDNSKQRNSIFHFKRFDVADAAGAMKIGTDGVLLGAWATVAEGDSVWDAGCGTGLIGLMTLQRGAASVTGFEINAAAADEARRNIASSPWPENFIIETGDFTDATRQLDGTVDLIVSNPPFFNESLKSPDNARASARHEGTLNFRTLLETAYNRLNPGGRLCVIAPATRLAELEFEGELRRMSIWSIATVSSKCGKTPKRVMLEWRREPAPQIKREEIAVRDTDGNFTERYRQLTSGFYLNMQPH